MVSGNTEDAIEDNGSTGLGSAGFGDVICFVASFGTFETTGLIIGDDVTIEDVTSHLANVANGFRCCC